MDSTAVDPPHATNDATNAAGNADGPPIFPGAHRAKLAASGLTDETILEAGIRSTGDVGEIAALLNRKSAPRAWGSSLVFPYRDVSGAVVLNRLRPSNPPIDRKTGKPAKYLQPSGVPVRLYVPPRTFAVLDDPTARLLVTEGELKALAATQAGFHCVGLSGVDCWHPKYKVTLLPDLARIAWKGRKVYIAFDSDAAKNPNVDRNERELAAVLTAHGATVKIVRILPGPAGEKMGLDDYLVAHGPGNFSKLIDAAEDPMPPDAGELLASVNDLDPASEAAHMLATVTIGGLSKMRFWRGSWYLWSRGRYVEVPPEEVRAEVVNEMNRRWLGVRSRNISDVIEHIKAKAILAAGVEPPSWLAEAPHGWAADDCLPTKSAIAHLPSLNGVEPHQIAATPALLATNACDFTLDLNAPRPFTWFAFLEDLWADDPQSIEALQEWFGYLLVHDTRQQKMLLLVGPKRSGKGTIARVLTALIGKGNVAAPTLGGLATNFGLWPLIGKSVAIISDARLSGRSDQAAVVERLLSITGEDSITVDRKNMSPITLRLPTRFVILTNELPRLNDASGAIVSRVILLHTNQSFYGREDHDLTDKLLPELPGILLWAIEGWRRLRARGRFLQPDSGRESIDDMGDLASPVAAFTRDCCNLGASESVQVSDLFAAWEKWCKTQGREKFIGTVQTFARDLLAVESRIRRTQPREQGGRVRMYVGIGLKGDW
jgi:putative DNA primase/helicase